MFFLGRNPGECDDATVYVANGMCLEIDLAVIGLRSA